MSRHVVNPQEGGEPTGVLTRAQRAALGLSLPTGPSPLPHCDSRDEPFIGAKSTPTSMLSDIDGAFLEEVADLQQVKVQAEAPIERAKPTAEAILKNTFQQVSLYDMLRLAANLRTDILPVIQALYLGAGPSGGHLPIGRIQATAFQASSGWQRNNMQKSFHQFSKSVQDLSSDTEKDIERTPAVSSSSVPSNSADMVIINKPAKGSNGTQSDVAESEEHVLDAGGEARKVGMSDLAIGLPAFYENTGQTTSGVKDMDSFDLTAGMQEAMHLSNLEMSGAEFTRKEVPFEVVPGHTLAKVDFPLSSLVSLQKILFDEEQAAYNLSLTQSSRNGKLHPLTSIHHSATYQASLCKLMEYCLSPVLSSLWDRIQENNIRLASLKEEAINLQLDSLSKGTQQSVYSQRRTPESVGRGNAYASFPERSQRDSRRG
ncbi:hypothetical protein L7F22_026565 [Adiantum nelumboides]|nr:hypothetical protein [Adiantum nelumboides]